MLDYTEQERIIRNAFFIGNRRYSDVVNKVISKYKSFAATTLSNYAAIVSRDYTEMLRFVKENCIHYLTAEVAKKIKFTTIENRMTMDSEIVGSVYVLTEEEIKGLVWDSYLEALNTMRSEVYK